MFPQQRANPFLSRYPENPIGRRQLFGARANTPFGPPGRSPFGARAPLGLSRRGPTLQNQPKPVGQNKGDLMSYFRKSDGKIDFGKITSTASQMRGMYTQVSGIAPMITKFFGR
ncbi:YppG family protein [Bacillus sp. DJP31]|uniref:YppG family protein n=1 Tax=Bacillus sp. DJP31 TaxID=3409789 RepID=UPI003BB65A26